MGKKIIVANCDDWEGVYVDGTLVKQHHHVLEDWMQKELESLGYEFEYIDQYHELDYLDNGNGFPDDVEDLLLENGFYYGEEEQARL